LHDLVGEQRVLLGDHPFLPLRMTFTRAGELALAGAAGAWQAGNDNQLTIHLLFREGEGEPA
jgi:hypothetical protein